MESEPPIFVPERESLRRLLRIAATEFADTEHQRRIRGYVRELSHLMPVNCAQTKTQDAERAEATSAATGEDVISLLCKLEDYLESVIVSLPRRKHDP
jgi:hypothetical protein